MFDWRFVNETRAVLEGVAVILAGGLTPANVGDAILTARPQAVDTASGVESAVGVKDIDLVRAFVAGARSAFAKLGDDEQA